MITQARNIIPYVLLFVFLGVGILLMDWEWPAASDVNAVFDGVESFLTSVAILVGGVWAYFKFVKGRTFRTTLELSAEARVTTLAVMQLVHVKVRVRNSGGSNAEIRPVGSGIRLSGWSPTDGVTCRTSGVPVVENAWRHLSTTSVFADHSVVEPNEVILESFGET